MNDIRYLIQAASLKEYEQAADKVAEITGGTAKVWGPDALLIEDAGPGIHFHFKHHGELLEISPGAGHPNQLAKWLENLAYEMEAQVAMQVDFKQVSKDPNEFAKFLAALLQSKDLRARAQGTKVAVASQRDIVRVLDPMLNERSREAIQTYFQEPG